MNRPIKFFFAVLCLTAFSLQAADTQSTSPQTAAPPFNLQGHMSIDPKMRAQDYTQAFEMLKKEKTSGKVFIEIAGSTTLTNVIEMNPMGNGTLLLFKYNSPQGIKYQLIEVEKILSIGHL